MAENGLPNSFAPGRNLIFLTFAAALAYRRGARHLVAGVCETDFSGYPDCRDDAIKAMQVALNLGMETRFVGHTPPMWIDKAATWAMTRELGGDRLVDLVRQETHSCYLGERGALHDWGHGRGECAACCCGRPGGRGLQPLEPASHSHVMAREAKQSVVERGCMDRFAALAMTFRQNIIPTARAALGDIGFIRCPLMRRDLLRLTSQSQEPLV